MECEKLKDYLKRAKLDAEIKDNQNKTLKQRVEQLQTSLNEQN